MAIGTITIGTKFISVRSDSRAVHLALNQVNGKLIEFKPKKDWRTGAITHEVASRYYWRSKDKRELRYHEAFKGWVLGALKATPFWNEFIVNELPPQTGVPTTIPMVDWFSYREGQEKFADFLLNHPYHTRILPAFTGAGKTATALSVISALGVRAYIFVAPKLVPQWQGATNKFLVIIPDEICYIAGADAIIDAAQLAREGRFNYKIVLFSPNTIQAFLANFEEEDYGVTPEEFFALLGGGVKIVDEAHQWMEFNALLDSFINTAVNIYLTATLTQEQYFLKKMETMLYPPQHRCDVPPPPKHLNIVGYQYMIDRGKGIPQSKGPMGYNHAIFERYFKKNGNRRQAYFEMIYHAMNTYYFKRYPQKGLKALVYFSTTALVHKFVEFLRRKEPNRIINEFIAGSDEDKLNNSDVVISTTKKTGTGTDLPGLVSVFQTINIAATGENLQNSGRIRVIDNEGKDVFIEPYFVYFYSKEIERQEAYHHKRRQTLSIVAKTYLHDYYTRYI